MNGDTIYTDGTYLQANPGWHAEDTSWKAGHILRMLNQNAIKPTTIGEFGCGTGLILHELAKNFGPDVTLSGFEVSPVALELCRKHETSNVRFFPQQAADDPAVSFDVLLLIDVIEHVEDLCSMLRRVRTKAALKIFHIPLDLSAQSVLRESPLCKWRREVGHLHFFTKGLALSTLQETGYHVIDHFYTKTNIELGNRGWRADLMKIPRMMLYRMNKDFAARLLGGFSLLVLAK